MSKDNISREQSALVLWLKMHMYMIIAAGVLVVVVVGFVYLYILSPKYEAGELHIKDILPAKDLKSWQADLDVLVNLQDDEGHYYTSLVTTKMTAGINMDDVLVQEDAETIDITIPQAKNISLESNHEKSIREDMMDSQTISAAKVFARDYAMHILESEYSLQVAQKEAVRLVDGFAQVVAKNKNKKVSIQAKAMPNASADVIELSSERTGIFLQHFPLKNKWESKVYSPEEGEYALYEWNSQSTKIRLYNIGMLQKNKGPLATFRCDASDGKWANQFNPLNDRFPFGMYVSPKSNSAMFCWQADGQVYKMDFIASDKHAYQEKLPDAMMLAYGVRYNADFLMDKDKRYALGGLTEDKWNLISSEKQLGYFLEASKYTHFIGMKRVSYYENADVYINKDSIDPKAMKKLWENIPQVEHSDIRIVLYEHRMIKKDRVIAISPYKIYFFIPGSLISSSKYQSVTINNLASVWGSEKENFDAIKIKQFIDAIVNHKLFDMISIKS